MSYILIKLDIFFSMLHFVFCLSSPDNVKSLKNFMKKVEAVYAGKEHEQQ